MEVSIYPSNAKNKSIKWQSDNKYVASVDENGMVKTISSGTATITATSANGKTAKCVVNVVGLKLSDYYVTLKNIDDTFMPKVQLTNGKDVSVAWESRNPNIVSVDATGKIIAKRGGYTNITAISEKYGSISYGVYVCAPVTLPDGSKAYVGDMNRDGYFNSTDKSMILDLAMGSGNRDMYVIADVNGDGLVNSTDGSIVLDWFKNNTFCPGKYYPITGVIVDKTTINLDKGKYTILKATVNPENTTDSPKLVWESSDTNVATVDENGKITAVDIGEAIITVTTTNGKKATCEVNVKKKAEPTVTPSPSPTPSLSPTPSPSPTPNSTPTPDPGEKEYELGDVNGDGEIDAKDAKLVLQAFNGKVTLTEEQKKRANVNKDGDIDAKDAKLILQKFNGKIKKF